MKKMITNVLCITLMVAILMLSVSACAFANRNSTLKRESKPSQSSEQTSTQSEDISSESSISSGASSIISSQNIISNQIGSQTSVQSVISSNITSITSSNSDVSIITSSDNTSSVKPSQTTTSSTPASTNITSSNIQSKPNSSYSFPFKAGLYCLPTNTSVWTDFSKSNYLTDEKTYENIKSQGFDHIKLLIDFHSMYSAKDKSLNEKSMKAFDDILDIIENQGLYVFVYACVSFNGWEMNYDSNEDLEEFVAIWDLIAQRYKDRSELVYFALVDEPHTTDINKINAFLTPAINAIRKTNPTRKIVCPAADANQAWLLEEYRPPVTNDDNLILAIHTFNPAEFTHQGCTWAGQNKGQVRLTQEHKDTLNWDLEQVQKFMRYSIYRDIPVMINAFGLNLSLANEEDASEFIRIITQFCKDNNMPWALWSYNNGDFSIYKEGSFFSKGSWNQNALDALFLR